MKRDKCSDELEEVEHKLLNTTNKKEEDIKSSMLLSKFSFADNKKIFAQALTLVFLAK